MYEIQNHKEISQHHSKEIGISKMINQSTTQENVNLKTGTRTYLCDKLTTLTLALLYSIGNLSSSSSGTFLLRHYFKAQTM